MFLTIKLCTYVKLNSFKLICIKMDLALNNLQRLICHKTQTNSHETLHLALSLLGIYSAAASVWAVTKFSYSSFEVCLSDG